MITTLEEANKHVHVSAHKYNYIIVLECGQVYCSNSTNFMQVILDENNCFVVKGDLKKKVKKQIKKEEE